DLAVRQPRRPRDPLQVSPLIVGHRQRRRGHHCHTTSIPCYFADTPLEVITGESPELESSTPVVCDAAGPVALAGIMGGAVSAVSATSRRFALEVATFRPTVVRRSSQRLMLRTEASARFEKGLDTPRVDTAVDLFLHLLGEVAFGAKVSGMQDVELDPTTPAQVEVDLGFLTTRIGRDVSVGEARSILRSLGFAVTVDGDRFEVTAPTWRSTGDVSLPHDIVEEVARIQGFDNLPVAPLSVVLKPVRSLNRRPLDRAIREQLASRAAMQEVVTYPWVADATLLATGSSKDETVRFEGAPAADRDSLRPSLVPNLLEAVASNLRYAPSFRLFEVGTVFASGPLVPFRDTFEPLPRQALRAAAVFVGTDGAGLFRQAKGVLEMLRRYCHLTDLQLTDADVAPWADRSARLKVTAGGRHVGALGLLTTRCRRLAGIDKVQVACFELDLGSLSEHPSRENRYEPVPELPEADFDLSVVVADRVRWSEIATTVSGVDGLISRVTFVDEFRGAWVPEGHRSLTLRVTLQPRDTTLTAEAIAVVRGGILAALEREFSAYLRESPPAGETGR
ncbi:MAG: phenylalanine--tRNA ligase subunit beta, partial [Pseudonocardiaceae bacterium]|nr:phenylalanine--tRNA ligase subunit beta [Pseudonocardiaceae bacterium]